MSRPALIFLTLFLAAIALGGCAPTRWFTDASIAAQNKTPRELTSLLGPPAAIVSNQSVRLHPGKAREYLYFVADRSGRAQFRRYFYDESTWVTERRMVWTESPPFRILDPGRPSDYRKIARVLSERPDLVARPSAATILCNIVDEPVSQVIHAELDKLTSARVSLQSSPLDQAAFRQTQPFLCLIDLRHPLGPAGGIKEFFRGGGPVIFVGDPPNPSSPLKKFLEPDLIKRIVWKEVFLPKNRCHFRVGQVMGNMLIVLLPPGCAQSPEVWACILKRQQLESLRFPPKRP